MNNVTFYELPERLLRFTYWPPLNRKTCCNSWDPHQTFNEPYFIVKAYLMSTKGGSFLEPF